MSPEDRDEDQIREMLREMRDETIPADSLARVRRGVHAGVEARAQRGWWKLAVSLATLTAAVVFAMVLWEHKSASAPGVSQIAPKAVTVSTPEPEPAEASVAPAAVETAVRRPRPMRRSVPRKLASVSRTPGMLIRIETPDPDVVILLVN